MKCEITGVTSLRTSDNRCERPIRIFRVVFNVSGEAKNSSIRHFLQRVTDVEKAAVPRKHDISCGLRLTRIRSRNRKRDTALIRTPSVSLDEHLKKRQNLASLAYTYREYFWANFRWLCKQYIIIIYRYFP